MKLESFNTVKRDARIELSPVRTADLRLAARLLVTPLIIFFAICQSAAAQSLEPITLAQNSAPLPSLYPTDVTRIPIGREQELFRPGPVYYFFQKLPPRSWFNLSVETSQRYESNVRFQAHDGHSDYVYRILPNITVGYNILKKTSVYVNYFVLKDVFAVNHQLTFPTNQSLSLGLRHEIPIGTKSTMQFDFQARELWQQVDLHQFDFLPGLTYTRVLTPKTVAFANIILQLRGKDYFVAPTREIDPFYTAGFLRSYGDWVLTAVATLVTNYRHPPFNDAIPPVSNNAIIGDLELSHPITKKIPGLVAFARAEPNWNWKSKEYPGISGFDFRFFTGLRYTLVKPSYYSDMEKLRSQLKEAGVLPGVAPGSSAPANQPESPPAETPPSPPGQHPLEKLPENLTPPQPSQPENAEPQTENPTTPKTQTNDSLLPLRAELNAVPPQSEN